MFLYIYVGFTYIENTYKTQLDKKYMQEVFTIKTELSTLIKEKKEAVLLLSLSVSENDKVKKLLKEQHFTSIDLEQFSTKLKKYSSLHNVWFQILSNEGISLYRSWTSKHGDSVLLARADIAQLLHRPRVISPISVGKYDLTFKSIVPIFDKNHFIGLVETIAKFNSISKKLQMMHWDNYLLVDPRYKQQLHVPKDRFIHSYYIAASSDEHNTLKKMLRTQLDVVINAHTYKIVNNMLVSIYTLKDVKSKDMAYFVLAKNLDCINTADIENQRKAQIAIAFVVFIAIALLLYYIYSINYKRFIEKQQKILQERVAQKTKELEEKSQTLKYHAEHDILTGLPNRLLFLDRLKEAIKHAYRYKERVTVLFLDLDRFKEINDTYGHETGDKLLQLVTKRLLEASREEDTVARLGGDEFTLILRNVSQNDILKVVKKIMDAMQEPFVINNVKHYTTFSIGISSYPEDGISHDTLLRNADIAMYKAKENGKNNYHFYNSEMTQKILERVELEKELHKALENKEFKAYYQPKVDAKHHKVIGLEALIRWQHPDKGIIYPDSFIPFAEEIGLIGEIDNYMMRMSMNDLLEWQKQSLECGRLSINLSARQLASKHYISELQNTLQEIGLDPQSLEIEITETHIMDNPQHAMQILKQIRSLGISISIDDFGTGYSSLSYLKKLPVTKLKIDKSFVDELPDDKDDVAIVKAIISLAKNLNLDIIAEGVENKEQVEFLVQEGCYDIQGYYFSKPLSKEECRKFLATF